MGGKAPSIYVPSADAPARKETAVLSNKHIFLLAQVRSDVSFSVENVHTRGDIVHRQLEALLAM
jgi:hypothetical protein